jgi:hypothetical protein
MVYPKVSGLAAWRENCKWYSSLPLGAVCIAILCVSLVSFAAITLRVASQRVFIVVLSVYFVIDSVRKLLDTPSYYRDSNFRQWPDHPVSYAMCTADSSRGIKRSER